MQTPVRKKSLETNTHPRHKQFFFLQLASAHTKTSIPPEHQAIIHGSFKLAASCLAPIIFAKMPKRIAFIICGALAAMSMATGTI